MSRADDGLTAPKPGLRTRVADGLSGIGAVRDGLLVSATVLYVVGYAVWSYNAWQNKLGLLPALDPQYFIAGVVPIVVVASGYVIVRSLQRFFIFWPQFVGEDCSGGRRLLRRVLLWSFCATFIVLLLGPIGGGAALLAAFAGLALARRLFPDVHESLRRFSLSDAYDSMLDVVWRLRRHASGRPLPEPTPTDNALVVALIFAVGGMLWAFHSLEARVFSGGAELAHRVTAYALAAFVTFLPPIKDRFWSGVARLYRAFWVYVAVPLLVAAALLFYLAWAYPRLPQEFGGVAPRCAYLDVVRAQLSKQTLEDIIPDSNAGGREPVVRSRRLDVLFAGSGSTLVRSRGRVYEIANGSIRSVTGCDGEKQRRAGPPASPSI